ncbi:MAG: hypothetical protein GY841_02720 [FCB group bacterium]|nr:hypothetical protein [FCB group bacterium]
MDIEQSRLVQKFLIDAGLGTSVQGGNAWPVYATFLPDSDDINDDAIVCYDTAGRTDGRVIDTGEHIEHPGFQIMVRSRNRSAGRAKANDIANVIDAVFRTEVTVDGSTYTLQNLSRTGQILDIGAEPEGRGRKFHSVNGVMTASKN